MKGFTIRNSIDRLEKSVAESSSPTWARIRNKPFTSLGDEFDKVEGALVIKDVDADKINFDNELTGMISDNVQDAIEEVFTSVSNGKATIADAITDKGVETSAEATFEQMATNIGLISGGAQSDSKTVIVPAYTDHRNTNELNFTVEKSGVLIVGIFASNAEINTESDMNNKIAVNGSARGNTLTIVSGGVKGAALYTGNVTAGDVVTVKGFNAVSLQANTYFIYFIKEE